MALHKEAAVSSFVEYVVVVVESSGFCILLLLHLEPTKTRRYQLKCPGQMFRYVIFLAIYADACI